MKRGADKMCFKTLREKVVDVRREESLKKFLTFEGRRIGEKRKWKRQKRGEGGTSVARAGRLGGRDNIFNI